MTKQDFEKMEIGTDLSFFKMPKAAQGIALELMDLVKNHTNPKSALVRELDSSISFRIACGSFDLNIPPKETDVVVRYFELTGGSLQ